jgi:acyl carrier protein
MDTRGRIAAIFKEVLAVEVTSFDRDIIADGLLDSLMLVTLLVTLEQRFNVTIPLQTIDIERLRTVDSIAVFVEETATNNRSGLPALNGLHR